MKIYKVCNEISIKKPYDSSISPSIFTCGFWFWSFSVGFSCQNQWLGFWNFNWRLFCRIKRFYFFCTSSGSWYKSLSTSSLFIVCFGCTSTLYCRVRPSLTTIQCTTPLTTFRPRWNIILLSWYLHTKQIRHQITARVLNILLWTSCWNKEKLQISRFFRKSYTVIQYCERYDWNRWKSLESIYDGKSEKSD